MSHLLPTVAEMKNFDLVLTTTMQVCTLTDCCVKQGERCFMRKWLREYHIEKPTVDTFVSGFMTPHETVRLCHAIGTMHELAKKYCQAWMCRNSSKTLESHSKVERMMLSIVSLWWEGVDIWTAIAYKVGARGFAVSASDFRACLKLPKGEPESPELIDDRARFNAAHKLFVSTCLAIKDGTTHKLFLETVRQRLKEML